MRGTGFVVFEVLLWLLVALLIGVLVGWLARGWRSERKIVARIREAHEADIAELNGVKSLLAVAEARLAELERSRPLNEAGHAHPPPSDDEAVVAADADPAAAAEIADGTVEDDAAAT